MRILDPSQSTIHPPYLILTPHPGPEKGISYYWIKTRSPPVSTHSLYCTYISAQIQGDGDLGSNIFFRISTIESAASTL